MSWVVQRNYIDQTQTAFVSRASLNAGNAVFEVDVGGENNTISPRYDETLSGVNFIPYGSTKLVRLAHELNWTGVFYNSNFSTVEWNAHRDDMLNTDAVIVPVSGIEACLVGMPPDLQAFIRPARDAKVFNGTVMRVDDVRKWAGGSHNGTRVKPDTLVSLAPKKHIVMEWRWFIVGGRVIDGSIYRMRNQRLTLRETDKDEISAVQQLADVWLPHETCVMDIARTDNGLKVIEFNAFNSSGFYNHDIPKIITAVCDHTRYWG